MSFLSEHAPPKRRALVGSWSSFSAVLGSLLASGIAALVTGLLAQSFLMTWGWRLPFLLGGLMGLFGLWLRQTIAESPSFQELRNANHLSPNPIAEALRQDLAPITITLGLMGMATIGFYLPFVWLPSWLSQINQPPLPEQQALMANTIALTVLLLLTPCTALISDRLGRRPMILATALSYILLSYPVFLLLANGTFTSALLGGLVFAVCFSFFSGCMAATQVELFPTRTRYSGMAIGYNVAIALLGGTSPWVATQLIDWSGNKLAPSYYLTTAAIVAVVTSLFLKVRHGRSLN